ncbi:hypothetical protein [Celeribacter sp.]|uniref:hypothetical protein n=1 Tax=Celeribacter sp. TaxID=1890673 RepID=UPI003A8F1AC2
MTNMATGTGDATLMSDRSKSLIEMYSKFRQEFDALPMRGRYMPYDWYTLPEAMSATLMPYTQMLHEQAREISNIINDLTNNVLRLRAWHEVTREMDNQEKVNAVHEFIGNLGTVSLGQPYAIKSRFAYSVGHLSHQANRVKDGSNWIDDLPEENLNLNDIESSGKPWKKYRKAKLKIERIADRQFKSDTDDFRNAYNNRFSVHLLIGQSGSVKRNVEFDGRIYDYAYGESEPLELAHIADLLQIECEKCYDAFEAYQALIDEQITRITEASS